MTVDPVPRFSAYQALDKKPISPLSWSYYESKLRPT